MKGEIIDFQQLDRKSIITLLEANSTLQKELFQKADNIRKREVGNKVFFRGLIEFSNLCNKDCYYCGIRKSNKHVERFNLLDNEIIDAAMFACDQEYASIVLQSGELESKSFITRIDRLLRKIHQKTNGKLRITLSVGEQDAETYKKWYESGAHRYLLRIESSNSKLYEKLHPADGKHQYLKRLNALESLKKIGYQTGTGVMIGLPFQTISDLADDLMFMKNFEVDMVGMGPYIEHHHTPLFEYRNTLIPLNERLLLSIKMIALLRLLMPKINIAAATALQAIDKMGREKALRSGANVIMPNITPGKYRNNYKLYDNKPCTDENPEDCTNCLQARIAKTGNEIGLGDWGDSLHYSDNMQLHSIISQNNKNI
jgi:biotin synthase